MNTNQTIQTYRENAKEFSRKFDAMGARVEDIARAFLLAEKKENPKVVEIGCGNGRDALEISKYTRNYIGFDGAFELIEIAQERNPGLYFEVAQFEDMYFPEGTDIVFAFASLLHVDRGTFLDVFTRIHGAMNNGGIVYLSLQYGEYGEYEKTDEQGMRLYYFYTPEYIQNLVGEKFESVFVDYQEFRGQKWFTMALRKAG